MTDTSSKPAGSSSSPGGDLSSIPAIIGWRERVNLPDWGIRRLLAKADTGAAHSAIDVGRLELIEEDRVAFDVVISRKTLATQRIEAEVVRRSVVKSSLGDRHDRLYVATTLELGPVRKTVEIGLVERSEMICRMLIGRSALTPECLVDSGRRYLLSARRKRGDGSSMG